MRDRFTHPGSYENSGCFDNDQPADEGKTTSVEQTGSSQIVSL